MRVPRRLMVVGASPGNLGMRVFMTAAQSRGWEEVRAFDKNPSNRVQLLDLTNRKRVLDVLEQISPTDIVCTAGINLPDGPNLATSLSIQLQINAWGPLSLLSEAVDLWRRWHTPLPETGFNMAIISSNSAQIARSGSIGYCSSKAALSMGIRCMARREADTDIKIWGYEPGFIVGTPMSQEAQDRFSGPIAGGGKPLHRIPGDNTVDADDLADQIVADLLNGHRHFNGCMFRIDGGEQ